MAVSSIKICLSRMSAVLRAYIDQVDSYYRPDDENSSLALPPQHYASLLRHKNTSQINGRIANDRSPLASKKDKRSSGHRTRNQCPLHPNNFRQHHHHHNNSTNNLSTEQSCIEGQSSIKHQISATSQLPATISKKKTSQGQVYFVDSNGHRYWNDPSVPKELLTASLNLDVLVGPLSSTWEVRHTSTGKTYYVNHAKKTTQFTDPRLVKNRDYLMGVLQNIHSNATISKSVLPKDMSNGHKRPTRRSNELQLQNKKELYDKISILRQELLKQQVIAYPCKIDISRKRIFEESFRVVSQMHPRDLKKRLLVKFKGEEGLDYGGVAREWFYLLSREILNPVHGLFQYTSDDNYNLQINPDSGIVYREHLSYLNFCGRIIGMAVFHGHFIEGHFSLPFYKMLLSKPINLCDIEFVDPDLHRSLCWILDNDITDIIDTTFTVQHNAFGQLQEHELKENGKNIVVTEENKHEYVSLYVNYRCKQGIEYQFEALQRGFYELISPSLVENFDEAELELLVGGLSQLNIDDWRQHTKLKNCTTETPIIKWFWNIVTSYKEEERARLLQFVTGSPRVPIQGFKALQGVNSELRLFTIHLIRNACTDNLPKSHTCFNRIDLPPYESFEKLRDKLSQAIEETMGFAMQ